jgi:thiol-disulfide isomerase/thioredoxin
MRYLVIIGIIALSFTAAKAQGIEFFHGTWEEALTEAKLQEKVIFVDAYATWCGPCKRMAKEVFPDEKVGEFYNRYFINMKLDMERGEGLQFRKEYPVAAFPTLFFINGDGEVVQKVKGAQGVGSFLDLGKKVLSLSDNSEEYAELYEDGERDPDFIYKYVKSLNNSGKSSLRIANDYLNSQSDLSTEFNLKFILEATTTADSRIFDLLTQYRSQIEAVTGKEEVENQITLACKATALKANEYNSLELLEEAQKKMEEHCPEKAEMFTYDSYLDFHLTQRNPNEYAKVCKKYAKKVLKDNAVALDNLATNMYKNFTEEKVVLAEAEAIAKAAVDKEVNYRYYATYARILKDNGKEKEAIENAEKALELARAEGPHTVRMMESFIQQIKS